MKRVYRTKEPAFSLVQLLVVIAIIAVLASILIPTISGVLERAKDTRCRQNLRDMGMALLLYVNENDGRFIPGVNDGSYDVPVPAWGPTWAEYFVRKYFDRNKAILHCPSRPSHWSNAAGYYTDYAYNFRLSQDSSMGFMTINRVLNPSKTLAFVESVRPDRATATGGVYSISFEGSVHYRHREGTVAYATYVDGHLEEVEYPAVNASDPSHPFHQSVFRYDLQEP